MYTPVLDKHSKHFVLADAIDIWLRQDAAQFRADAGAG